MIQCCPLLHSLSDVNQLPPVLYFVTAHHLHFSVKERQVRKMDIPHLEEGKASSYPCLCQILLNNAEFIICKMLSIACVITLLSINYWAAFGRASNPCTNLPFCVIVQKGIDDILGQRIQGKVVVKVGRDNLHFL